MIPQGLEVDVQKRDAAAFTADLETVRAFGVSALEGCVDASSLSVQATGATCLHCHSQYNPVWCFPLRQWPL